MEFRKWNQGLKSEWRIESKGYEARGQKWTKGGTGIRVPVLLSVEIELKRGGHIKEGLVN